MLGSAANLPNFRSFMRLMDSESGFPGTRVGISEADSEREGSPSSAKAAMIAALAASEAAASPALTISHIRRMSRVERLAFSTDTPLNSEVAVRTTSAPMSFMNANITATGMTVTASPSPSRVVFMEAFI